MFTPTGKRSTELDQLNQEDWEALNDMFEVLEAIPAEQIENGVSSKLGSSSEVQTENAENENLS